MGLLRIARRRAEKGARGHAFRPLSDDEVGGCQARSARSERQRAQQSIQPSEPRQALQNYVDGSGDPAGNTECKQIEISEESAAGKEGEPEDALRGCGPGAVAVQFFLEPHHYLVGPLELTGPNRKPEQHERDAARSWDWAADEPQGDQDEPENANSEAVDRELALVLPDLAPPAPAVFARFDEDVMVMMLMLLLRVLVGASGSVRSFADTRQRHRR